MYRNYFLIPAAFLFSRLQAQEPFGVAEGYTSVQAFSREQPEVFSQEANQATLAGFRQFSMGAYSERRFLLRELSVYRLAAVVAGSSGSFGIGAGYMGGPSFHQATFHLGYGRSMGKTDLGIGFGYRQSGAAGYDQTAAVTLAAGMILHPVPSFQTGIRVRIPAFVRGSKEGDRARAQYAMGFGWDASPRFFWGACLEKEQDMPVRVRSGISYRFHPLLGVRFGVSSTGPPVYGGISVQTGVIRIEITASMHAWLGPTPGMMLSYGPNKKP